MRLINELGGVEAFGVASILLFVIVFSGSMIWAVCQKKTFLRAMEILPLEDQPIVQSKAESKK